MRTEVSTPLKGRRLLVAVSGSIAAVKTPLLVSALVKAGAEVRCLVTPSAAKLVSPLALATLSRHRCYQEDDEWDSSSSRPLHIELAEWAELILVAPVECHQPQSLEPGISRRSARQRAPGLRMSGVGRHRDEHGDVEPSRGSTQLEGRADLPRRRSISASVRPAGLRSPW